MAKRLSRGLRRVLKHKRIRAKLLGNSTTPRLCLFKSNRSIYLQVVDDSLNRTLFSISTLHSNLTNTVSGATSLGALLAERLLSQGFNSVRFDRSGYVYHGKVAAVADALRERGISF